MAAEEGQVEDSVEEYSLRKESPVDCPAVEELSLELKGAMDVRHGVGQEEGGTKDQLQGETR